MAFGDILSSIGSGLSSFAGGAKEALVGRPGEFKQAPRFTPEQLDFLRTQLLPMLSQQLSQLGGQQHSFAPIAQEARQQFQQQTVPALAERFTAMTGGRATSPAFASQLGSAGAGLESSLAALGSKYGLAQQGLQNQQLQMLLGAGLSPQFDTGYMQGSPGLLQYGAQGLGNLFGLTGLSRLGLL